MTGMSTPYGAWPSPITSGSIASGSIGLDGVVLDGDGLWWTEARSSEGGRVVVVHQRADGTVEDVFSDPYNARSRVHEYGGGAVTIAGDVVFFVDFLVTLINPPYFTLMNSPPNAPSVSFLSLPVSSYPHLCVLVAPEFAEVLVVPALGSTLLDKFVATAAEGDA